MSMPSDIGVVDTMLGIPSADKSGSCNWLRPLLRDRESLEAFEFREHVWPKFLRDNAVRVFKLDG